MVFQQREYVVVGDGGSDTNSDMIGAVDGEVALMRSERPESLLE